MEQDRKGITAGILADIAQELSDLSDWENRLNRALRMLCTAMRSGTVALAVRMPGWKAFFCPDAPDVDTLNTTLRWHYCMLSPHFPADHLCTLTGNFMEGYEPGSIISLPIIGAGHVIGLVHATTEEEDAYNIDDVSVLSIAASLIGSFLTNVRLYTEERKARKEVERAEHEAEKQAAELRTVMGSMADGIAVFDPSGPAMYMNEAGRNIFGIPLDADPGNWLNDYKRYSIETGEPIPVESSPIYHALQGETFPPTRYVVDTGHGKDASIEVNASPVKDADGNVIAVVSVFRDIEEQVSYEREREKLLEREHRIADTLQRALVSPQAAYDILGCRIATIYQPALREAEVGGDFYDIFTIPGEKLGILVGDVVGKGLNAAVSVAAARYSIRSYAYQGLTPSAVLTMVNNMFSDSHDDMVGMFAAFYAVIDVNESTITYSSGGTEPAVLCTRSGMKICEQRGRLFGIEGGFTYPEESRKLSAGDKLIVVTDGITEARKEGILFGIEGMLASIRRCCRYSPKKMAENILKSAMDYAGGSLQDDAAIVVMEYRRGS